MASICYSDRTFISINIANCCNLKSAWDTHSSKSAVGISRWLRIVSEVWWGHILLHGATITPPILWLISTSWFHSSASSSPLVHRPLWSGRLAPCRIDWLQNPMPFTVCLCCHNCLTILCRRTKENGIFFDRNQQLVKKVFNFHVDAAVCLEKASGWVLITLAIELGCQLASSDNCFPWQDPVGWEKSRAMQGINTGIYPQPSHNSSTCM